MFGNSFMRFRAMNKKPALKSRAARDHVAVASERMLAGADAYADHPWANAGHQMFSAYYMETMRFEKARPYLERGGSRAAEWAWCLYTNDEQRALNEARRTYRL